MRGSPSPRLSSGVLSYWLVVIVFAIAKLWTFGVDIPGALYSTTFSFVWPGLEGVMAAQGGQNSAVVLLRSVACIARHDAFPDRTHRLCCLCGK